MDQVSVISKICQVGNYDCENVNMTFLLGSQAGSCIQVSSVLIPPITTETSAVQDLCAVWRELLRQCFSTRGDFAPPTAHLAMSDIFACHTGVMLLQLVGGGQGCY